MHLTNRRFRLALATVFVLAFGLRVGLTTAFVGLDAPPDFDANPDQIDYELFGYRASIGEGFTFADGTPTARRSPGTSWALVPVYAITGRSFAAARLWFCFLSAATCVAVAWVAVQLAGRGAALCAAALLAIYPGHAYYAMHFVSEVPYCLMLALGTGAAIQAWRSGGRWALPLAGACFGYAILCRTQLTLLVPITALVLAALFRKMPRDQWWRGAKQSAGVTAVIAVVLAPWLIRNAVVFGKPVLTNIAGLGLWGAHNPITFNEPSARGTWLKTSDLEQKFGPLPTDEVLKDEEAKRRGVQSIAVNFPRLPQIALYKLGRFVWPFADTPNQKVRWAFAIAWMGVLPFIAIGAWVAWKRSRGDMLVLLLPVIATVVSVVLFYGSVRFRDSIAPLFVTFAGIGVARVLAAVFEASVAEESLAPIGTIYPAGEERKAA